MRVAITGASGMLGTALIDELASEYEIFATSRTVGFRKSGVCWECFDLTNLKRLKKWLIEVEPDVVIHCAAMVNVDQCEDNIDIVKKLHIDTTDVIASHLDCNKKKLIYISTDSVFDGRKSEPYVESDQVNPLNTYAKTKLLGERFALSMQNGLVLRTNIIGWSKLSKVSFVEWVLQSLVAGNKLTLFGDVTFSPLHVSDLSKIINRTITENVSGLYHCSSCDHMSKYNFGVEVAKAFDISTKNVEKISLDDINFKAERPRNMALNSNSLSLILKAPMPSAMEAIQLMKNQYDNGWLSRVIGIDLTDKYAFWRKQ